MNYAETNAAITKAATLNYSETNASTTKAATLNYVQTVAATLLNYTASNATLNYGATNTATGKPTTLNDTINNAATSGLSYYNNIEQKWIENRQDIYVPNNIAKSFCIINS